MRGRLLLAGVGVAVGASPLFAQFPPPAPLPPLSFPPARVAPTYPPPTAPLAPRFPAPGGALPPTVMPAQAVFPQAVPQPGAAAPTRSGTPDGTAAPAARVDVPLPQPENKVPLDAGAVTARRAAGGWQVWSGPRLLKTLGDDEMAAKDVVRVLRELRPTEWVSIGTARPVVEYGLINGQPAVVGGFPRQVVPIDFRTVRVEPVRGVWCLRDDANILFNFGTVKADADQALAVVRKYAFNRVGMVGSVTAPALTYFFVSLEAEGARPAANPLAVAAQEGALARTGIPVPGLGYVGEMVKIDPRQVTVRRERTDWVVASGAEVLARFGPAEATARDAARVIQDGRFTEFCKVGTPGVTFFLVNGQAPTHVPFSVQGRRYDPAVLKVHTLGTRCTVSENGRPLFDVGSPEEGEAVLRLLKYYGFDQVCQIGPTARAGLTFLAKSR